MIKMKRVEKKDFSAEDLKKTYVGLLLSKIRETTPCYAAKFETNLKELKVKGSEYTENFTVFNLMKDGKIIDFEKKSFPIEYTTSGKDKATVITVNTDNEIEYSTEEEKTFHNQNIFYLRYNDPEYDYSGLYVKYFTLIDKKYHMYLNSLTNINYGDTIDDIDIYSEISVEGTDYTSINLELLDDYESAIFEHIVIFTRFSNMSPLLYGYLTLDDKIYRVVCGDFCGNNL